MGSWVRLDGQFHLDLIKPVMNSKSGGSPFIKCDVEKVQNQVIDKLKKLFEQEFQNGFFNLDTGFNYTWMEDRSNCEEFSWKDETDGSVVYDYHHLKEITVTDYSKCILVLNIWDRYGHLENAQRFVNQFKAYCEHRKIDFEEFSSNYIIREDCCNFYQSYVNGESTTVILRTK